MPEHLPGYVTAVSPGEPFLIDDFILYLHHSRLVFVGYPFRQPFDLGHLADIVQQAQQRFEPDLFSLIAPQIPPGWDSEQISLPASEHPQLTGPTVQDYYYHLAIASVSPDKKLRNLLRSAARNLSIETATSFGREHRRLVNDFLRSNPLDPAIRTIFKRLPQYARQPSARLIEARDQRGRLIAFDLADFTPHHYAFYLFNFRSSREAIPGASDLLLAHIIDLARAEGKSYLNLGLGINPGVIFFKTKWGATPLIPYHTAEKKQPGEDPVAAILDRLF